MTLAGETDLRTLLAGMTPALRAEFYVFRALRPGEPLPDGIAPFATVREDEGLTIVIESPPVAGLPNDETFRAITLGVHSSPNAVGFIAAVARALADAGVPANVFAGYHHDHVLVPTARANDAMNALRELADSA